MVEEQLQIEAVLISHDPDLEQANGSVAIGKPGSARDKWDTFTVHTDMQTFDIQDLRGSSTTKKIEWDQISHTNILMAMVQVVLLTLEDY